MGMRSNDDRFFQTHTRVPFLDKEITGNTINIPTEVSCIVPFICHYNIASLAAVLSAMAPELAPFMADELLLSMPEVEGIDYTMKEYMKLVDQTKQCVERLNAQGETRDNS